MAVFAWMGQGGCELMTLFLQAEKASNSCISARNCLSFYTGGLCLCNGIMPFKGQK